MKIQSKNLKFNQKLEYFHPCSTIPIPPMCIIHGWNVCSKKLLRTPSRLMIFITNLRSKWQILFCALSFNFYRVIDQINHCSMFYWRKRCKVISKIKTSYIIFFIKIFKWQVCRCFSFSPFSIFWIVSNEKSLDTCTIISFQKSNVCRMTNMGTYFDW